MSKTFNKNIQYTFNPQITLPTSSGLSITGNSNTIGNLFTTGGNVGIGTTSPSTQLEISSSDLATLRLSGDNQDNASYDTGRLQTQIQLRSDNGNYGWNINHYNGPGSQAFGIEDVKSTRGNTRMYIDGSGNIGIGTTEPSTFLHIYNDDPILRIQHNSGFTSVNSGTLELVQSNITGVRMRYDGASDIFLLQHLTAGVTQANGVFSSDGGNIGVRNSAPAYNLDVTGSFRTTGPIYSNDATAVPAASNNYSTTSGSVNITGDTVIPGSSELMFTSTGVSVPSLNGRGSGTKIVLYPETNVTRGDYSMGIETRNMWFQVPSSREGFKFYQGTSANLVMITNGNVGIGTTSPGSTLDVQGGSWGAVRTFPVTSGGESSIGFLSNADNSIGTGATTSNWLIGINLTSYPIGQFNIRSNALGTASIFTIATNGNIGIGTTGPSTKLDVNGSSRLGSRGSQYASIRSFTATLSTGAGNPTVVTTTVNYGVTYPDASKLVIQVTTSSIGVPDTFVTSIKTIGTSSMVLNVVRIDAATGYANAPTAHVTIFELV